MTKTLKNPGGWRRVTVGGMVASVISIVLLWLFLPYDNPFVLFLRFNSQKALSFLGLSGVDSGDAWVYGPPDYPVDLQQDVAFIVKTGYGTQARIGAQLDALSVPHGVDLQHSLIIIADFASVVKHQGQDVPIHDVLDVAMRSDALAEYQDSDRLLKYRNMTATIRAGDTEGAKAVGKAVGWELDAMKFLPGLELAYRTMPGKKWYVMLDDDTYLLQPSFLALLGQLDPLVASYVGNAVGDYKGRFAHGGSSFIISQPAMDLVFGQDSDVLQDGYVESLSETWGDKLVATTFMQLGVYLDERYGHLFNGERPRITKIQRDRFCSPVVSFHGLAQPELMKEVGDKFRDIDRPVLWSDLWEMYEQPAVSSFVQRPIRQATDHVGAHGISSMAQEASSEQECLDACVARKESCLAWTWDAETKICHISPWMIIGEGAEETLSSGLNVAEVSELFSQCTHGSR